MAFGVAGVFGIGTFGAMTALLIAAITIALPLWASALIVTAVYVLITGVAAAAGRSAMHDMSIVPQQTIKTITDDVRKDRFVSKDPDLIRQDIEETQSRMGDTVEALAYKADIPRGLATR